MKRDDGRKQSKERQTGGERRKRVGSGALEKKGKAPRECEFRATTGQGRHHPAGVKKATKKTTLNIRELSVYLKKRGKRRRRDPFLFLRRSLMLWAAKAHWGEAPQTSRLASREKKVICT